MDNRSQPNRPRSPSSQHGVATVEFSLLIVPLLMMLFGVTEYGRAIYQYNTLVKSVREAARYLSTVNAGTRYGDAKCLAVYGTLTVDANNNCIGSRPLAPGLTTSMVTIQDRLTNEDHKSEITGSGTINLVTVTISGYQFRSLLNFSLGGVTIGAPNITFHPIHNTMRQI